MSHFGSSYSSAVAPESRTLFDVVIRLPQLQQVMSAGPAIAPDVIDYHWDHTIWDHKNEGSADHWAFGEETSAKHYLPLRPREIMESGIRIQMWAREIYVKNCIIMGVMVFSSEQAPGRLEVPLCSRRHRLGEP